MRYLIMLGIVIGLAFADFLTGLENQIHIPVSFTAVQLQRQPAQDCAMTIMPALVRDAFIL